MFCFIGPQQHLWEQKKKPFSFVISMQSLRTEAMIEILSIQRRLILHVVCWLMQPLPAHPDTAADILCQKRKIALASDGKIRKDCQDMHVVSWVKIRATMSLKEFVLSAFREQGGSSKHVGFESDAIKNLGDCAESPTICYILTKCSEKRRREKKIKATEMERVVVVHFKHVLPQGPAALHKRSSNQRCRFIKKTFFGFKSGPRNAWLHYFNFRRPDLYETVFNFLLRTFLCAQYSAGVMACWGGCRCPTVFRHEALQSQKMMFDFII